MSDNEESSLRGQKRDLESDSSQNERRTRRRIDSNEVDGDSPKQDSPKRLGHGALEAHSPTVEGNEVDSSSERQPSISEAPPTRERRHNTERMIINNFDASFILGTAGRTKKKLARVSRTELSVLRTDNENETILEIRGTAEAIDRAKVYIGFVMQQRVGPVHLDNEVKARNDIVILDIPHCCVGYVTGHKGQGLRSVEEEFSTLMFFTDVNKRSDKKDHDEPPTDPNKVEKLVIFSPSERSRQGAVLKVMSAIEQKMQGHFTKNVKPMISEEEGFATDVVVVNPENYSYALGKGGGTRKKLARASGAILEYIGSFAYIAGTEKQRERARKYLEWLCAQRVKTMDLTGIEERDDVTWIDVPIDCIAYVTGHKGQALRKMEEQTGTFIFLDSKTAAAASTEKLFIFGETTNGRKRAKVLAQQRINDKLAGVTLGMGRRPELYDRGGAYERDRERAWERDRYGNSDFRRSGRQYHASVSPSPSRHKRSPPRGGYRHASGYGSRVDPSEEISFRGRGGYYNERRESPEFEERRYSTGDAALPARASSPGRQKRASRRVSPPHRGVEDGERPAYNGAHPPRALDRRDVHYYEPPVYQHSPSRRYDSRRSGVGSMRRY